MVKLLVFEDDLQTNDGVTVDVDESPIPVVGKTPSENGDAQPPQNTALDLPSNNANGKVSIPNFSRGLSMDGARNSVDIGDRVVCVDIS